MGRSRALRSGDVSRGASAGSRVAQREHYLPGSVSRFALRWWMSRPSSIALGLVAVACAGLSIEWPVAAIGSAAGRCDRSVRSPDTDTHVTACVDGRASSGWRSLSRCLQAAIVGIVGAVLRAPAVVSFRPSRVAACSSISHASSFCRSSEALEAVLDKAKERLDGSTQCRRRDGLLRKDEHQTGHHVHLCRERSLSWRAPRASTTRPGSQGR